jgi:hypothetical protein
MGMRSEHQPRLAPNATAEALLTFVLRMSEAGQRKAGGTAGKAYLAFLFKATTSKARKIAQTREIGRIEAKVPG